MSRRRRYTYETVGSEEGLRRDIVRRRWQILLMVVLGGAACALLVYLTVTK